MSTGAIPPPLLPLILSYLSFRDLYLLRAVNTIFKSVCSRSLYAHILHPPAYAILKLGHKSDPIRIYLTPSAYDPISETIEFLPIEHDGNDEAVLGALNGNPRMVQVFFSEWALLDDEHPHNSPQQIPVVDTATTPASPQLLTLLTTSAQSSFHSTYNPSISRVFLLPDWSQSGEHYLGTADFILSFSYLDCADLTNPHHRIKVKRLLATPSFLISGMSPAPTPAQYVEPIQIFSRRYKLLHDAALARGIQPDSFDTTSEPVLAWILNPSPESLPYLLDTLEEGKAQTVLWSLSKKLEEVGIDPRCVWKYTHARRFLLGLAENSESNVVRSVRESEDVWRKEYESRKAIISEVEQKKHSSSFWKRVLKGG